MSFGFKLWFLLNTYLLLDFVMIFVLPKDLVNNVVKMLRCFAFELRLRTRGYNTLPL